MLSVPRQILRERCAGIPVSAEREDECGHRQDHEKGKCNGGVGRPCLTDPTDEEQGQWGRGAQGREPPHGPRTLAPKPHGIPGDEVRNPSKEVVVHGRGHERGEEEDADAPATSRSEQGIWIRLRSRLGLSVEAAGYPGPHYMEAGPSKLSEALEFPFEVGTT